jgi:hypothetical protein
MSQNPRTELAIRLRLAREQIKVLENSATDCVVRSRQLDPSIVAGILRVVREHIEAVQFLIDDKEAKS